MRQSLWTSVPRQWLQWQKHTRASAVAIFVVFTLINQHWKPSLIYFFLWECDIVHHFILPFSAISAIRSFHRYFSHIKACLLFYTHTFFGLSQQQSNVVTYLDLSLYTPCCDVRGCKCRSVALPILNLGTRCRWVINFTLRPALSLGKETRYPPNKRLNDV